MTNSKVRYLYHFTSLNSALSIFKEMRLRAGCFRNSNDPTENLYNERNLSNYSLYQRMQELKYISFAHDHLQNDECINMQPMWNHYGDKWKGVCIQIDKDIFVEENREIIKRYRIIDMKVDYSNSIRLPLTSPPLLNSAKKVCKPTNDIFEDWKSNIDNLTRRFFVKDNSWMYESEYRFLITKGYNDEINMSIKNSLKKVFLGIRYEDNTEKVEKLNDYLDLSKIVRTKMRNDRVISLSEFSIQ